MRRITRIAAASVLAVLLILRPVAGQQPVSPAVPEELAALRKFDANLRTDGAVSAADLRPLVNAAAESGFELLLAPDSASSFPAADTAAAAAAYPLPISGWRRPDWPERARDLVRDALDRGAAAVLFGRELGLALRDSLGGFVTTDDPRLGPVLNLVAGREATLLLNTGERREGWLPPDQIGIDEYREYFESYPGFYPYLHPEVPGYWELVRAVDSLMSMRPQLTVVAAGMARLGWDLDNLSLRLERRPNLAVDLAGAVPQLMIQRTEDVRRFFIRWQDRIVYASGAIAAPGGEGVPPGRLREIYRQDMAWLATGGWVPADRVRRGYYARGLELPMEILTKIFRDNALRWYPALKVSERARRR